MGNVIGTTTWTFLEKLFYGGYRKLTSGIIDKQFSELLPQLVDVVLLLLRAPRQHQQQHEEQHQVRHVHQQAARVRVTLAEKIMR